MRPQQLNINVATWVRLLKRDLPQQSPEPTRETASPSAAEPVPALPPKTRDQEEERVAPQPPPRIEEIEVSLPPERIKWGITNGGITRLS